MYRIGIHVVFIIIINNNIIIILTHFECVVTGPGEEIVPRGVKGHRVDSCTMSCVFE